MAALDDAACQRVVLHLLAAEATAVAEEEEDEEERAERENGSVLWTRSPSVRTDNFLMALS